MLSKVSWGILGCAGIARKQFIPALLLSKTSDPVAIASRDADKAQAWAREFGFRKAHGSYEALLEDADVQAVYIPVPNAMHAEWVVKAAQAGKHILCEKPLTVNAQEAEEMVQACAAAGVMFQEAFVYRYHPQTDQVAELLASGRIGELRAVHSQFHYHLIEGRDTNVRTSYKLAGGALMDVGCYCIQGARFAFGQEPQRVCGHFKVDPSYGVDTTAAAMLNFRDDRQAIFSCSIDMQGGQSLTLFGTEGEIHLPLPYHPRGDQARIVIRRGGSEEILAVPGGHPFQVQVDHFNDCLLHGQEPRLTAADGVLNMRVVDALQRSVEQGGWVDV